MIGREKAQKACSSDFAAWLRRDRESAPHLQSNSRTDADRKTEERFLANDANYHEVELEQEATELRDAE